MNTLCNIVGNHEQWVYEEIRSEKLQEQLKFIKDSKEFHDPDSPSSSGSTHVPHQHRIASSSKKERAANPDCREIHEEIRVFLQTLLIAILLDKMLTNCTMISWIWRPHREWQGKKAMGKLRTESQCKQYLWLAFRWKAGPTSLDRGNCPSCHDQQPCCGYLDLYSKWHDNSEVFSSEMHPWKIPWPNGISKLESKFQDRGLLKSEKSKLSSTMDHRKRNSQITGWLHHSKINYWQKLPRHWRIGFDDGGSIEQVLRQAHALP